MSVANGVALPARYELPDGWRWELLQSLVQMKKGKKPSQFDETPTTESLPYIDIEAFEKGLIKRYSRVNFGVQSDENDVLIVWDGARAGLTGKGIRGLLGSTIAGLSSHGINKDFLRYFLRSKYDQINSNTRGTGIPHVNPDFFWSLSVPVPPPPDQLRIVEKIESLLAEASTARLALEHTEPLFKKFRQSVLSAAFRGELTERDPKDEPASVLLERIRAERRKKWEEDLRARGKDPTTAKYVEAESPNARELGKLREGWVWSSLGEIFEITLGGTPSRKKLEYWNGSIPWVSSGEVAFGRIKNTREKITELGMQNSSARINPRGTVLLAMIGEGKTRGQSAILETSAANNQNVAAIHCASTPIPPEYVFYWLVSRYAETREAGSGGAQPALNRTRVMNIPIPLAPLDEQKCIVEYVESLFKRAEEIERAVEIARRRTDKMEQAILARAFRGEL